MKYKTISHRMTEEDWIAFKIALAKKGQTIASVLAPAIKKYIEGDNNEDKN